MTLSGEARAISAFSPMVAILSGRVAPNRIIIEEIRALVGSGLT